MEAVPKVADKVALVEAAKEDRMLEAALQAKEMLEKIQTTPTGLEAVEVLAKPEGQITLVMAVTGFKTILLALMFFMQGAVAVEKKPQDMRQMEAFPEGTAVAAKVAIEQTQKQQLEPLTPEAVVAEVVLLATEVEALEGLALLL